MDQALRILGIICFAVAFFVSFTRHADWTLRLMALGLTFVWLPTIT